MSIYIYHLVGTERGYMLDCRGSILSRDKIFLFSTISRPDLGPVQPPTNVYRRMISSGMEQQTHELTTLLHLVLRLKITELYLHPPYVFMAYSTGTLLHLCLYLLEPIEVIYLGHNSHHHSSL
jgi:hypothetical protein